MPGIPQPDLADLVRHRRTVAPKQFSTAVPDHSQVARCVDIARNAPNHHRTEPCRFYLLDEARIREVGRLYGELVTGSDPTPESTAKGERKAQEWGSSPGLLVVTQYTPRDTTLVRNKPEVVREDYATCCCIVQNLLLLLENGGIASKWSTGAVWEHPAFRLTVGIPNPPQDEEVVALVFYGKYDGERSVRELSPLTNVLSDYRGEVLA
jgi:nitroreductase